MGLTSLFMDIDALVRVVALHVHLGDGHGTHGAAQAPLDLLSGAGGARGDVATWHEHGLDLCIYANNA